MKHPPVKKILPVLVIAFSLLVVVVMMITREPPRRIEGETAPAHLVRTMTVARTRQRIDVPAAGTVMPSRAVDMQPQVSGRVIAVHERLQPGAVLERGEVLITIEPTDFEAAVAEAEAQVAQARADLALERGRSEVAATEFESYARMLEIPVNEALALRQPQRTAAEAALQRAEARLRRARADLERTSIRAPFDALVESESVDVGAQVGPQARVARLVAVDRYWVRATLPIAHLAFVAVPGFNAKEESKALVEQDAGTLRIRRQGRVLRLFGGVTPQGRLAQILIEVPDPLGRDDRNTLPLLLDAFVDVSLQGTDEYDVIRLPREYLHERDTVWVFADGTLDIRPVEVIWRSSEHVLIDDGLKDGERIVTSPLNNPVQGLRLKRADAGDA